MYRPMVASNHILELSQPYRGIVVIPWHQRQQDESIAKPVTLLQIIFNWEYKSYMKNDHGNKSSALLADNFRR